MIKFFLKTKFLYFIIKRLKKISKALSTVFYIIIICVYFNHITNGKKHRRDLKYLAFFRIAAF